MYAIIFRKGKAYYSCGREGGGIKEPRVVLKVLKDVSYDKGKIMLFTLESHRINYGKFFKVCIMQHYVISNTQ